MENDFISIIKNLSFETIIISILIFILTMIIKIPIKKMTENFSKEKRNVLNSLITFIPLFLSIVICILYSGIKFSVWFSFSQINNAFYIWLLSLSIYAIYEKFKLIIIAFVSGKENYYEIKEIDSHLDKLLEELKKNKNELKKTDKKLLQLNNLRESIKNSDNKHYNLQDLSKTNIEIKKLSEKEKSIKNFINSIEIELKEKYKTTKEESTNEFSK